MEDMNMNEANEQQQINKETEHLFPFHCPECGEGFEKTRWLGAHRYRAHGIHGTSPTATKRKWAPTPEQRKRYAETARKTYRDKKLTGEETVTKPIKGTNTQEDVNGSAKHARARHLAYAFGHCEAWAEIYAESVGISGTEFTQELGELFRLQSRRKVLGS